MVCFIGQTHIQASKNAILSSAPVPELVHRLVVSHPFQKLGGSFGEHHPSLENEK
jgi:hypothetical protein